MIGWKRKEEWRKYGHDFMVVVSRHSVEALEGFEHDNGGENRWAVYAYIYPKHPKFAAFDLTSNNMFQDAAFRLPLHCGPSYLEYHQRNNEISSIQVGADYNHTHDHFNGYSDPKDVPNVFCDAQQLYDALEVTI